MNGGCKDTSGVGEGAESTPVNFGNRTRDPFCQKSCSRRPVKQSTCMLLLGWLVIGLTDACTQSRREPSEGTPLAATASVADPGVVDTTVVIDNVGPILPAPPGGLTNSIAQQLVEAGFKAKGNYLRGEEPLGADTTGLSSCLAFDTSRTLDINHDGHRDALVSYWLMPCGSSGTCFLPTKALLVSESIGYRLIGEKFIPDEFTVETCLTDAQGQPVVQVSDWDCSEHRERRRLTVRIRLQ